MLLKAQGYGMSHTMRQLEPSYNKRPKKALALLPQLSNLRFKGVHGSKADASIFDPDDAGQRSAVDQVFPAIRCQSVTEAQRRTSLSL